MELLAVLCVCGWPVHVPSARNWEEVVGVSSKSAPSLKHHNSIHHAHCVPVPSAFRYVWIFASSIFSFLNLFVQCQRLIRDVFTIPGAFAMPNVQTAYSIVLLVGQNWCLYKALR